MKLKDILLLGFAAAFFIIGIDQTMKLGFARAYWAIMLGSILFFVYAFRKRKAAIEQEKAATLATKKPKKKPGKKSR